MNLRHLNDTQAATVRAWWSALHDLGKDTEPDKSRRFYFNRGDRAKLRRAVSLAKLQQVEACYLLRDQLGSLPSNYWNERDELWLFLIAGGVVHVGEDVENGRSLGLALGKSAHRDRNKPVPMSELRFRRMMSTDDPEDFYRQLRRALQLSHGGVDVAVLADDLLAWVIERDGSQQAAQTMRFRWARDYYLPGKERRESQEPTELSDPIANQEIQA